MRNGATVDGRVARQGTSALVLKRAGQVTLALAGLVVLGALVWQGITAEGVPVTEGARLDPNAVVLNSALLVFREGLEAILVLAAITASFVGKQQSYRAPVAVGGGLALLASAATWFVAIAVIGAVNAPALDVQAATGLLAIVVLLVIMNWFFHKIYWTGWISLHNKRRRRIVAEVNGTGTDGVAGEVASKALLGLGLLGFTSVYREGFEVVLFLQSLRLQAGSATVLKGVAIGLFFTATVGALTFVLNQKLPYKKMLVVTGVLLGVVLVVMVGESVQEMQLANWIGTTPVNLPIPGWMGIWFALFPNVEGLVAQAFAALFVLVSYVVAQYYRAWRPRRQSRLAAERAAIEG